MKFFKELFAPLMDPTFSSQSTPISQFKLNYPATETGDRPIPLRSEDYFTIKANAVAKDGSTDDQLPITIAQRFQLNAHKNIITEHTEFYKAKSAALVALDKKIMSAILLALVAAHAPFISLVVPFVGLVATVAWMATLYLLGQRINAYNEYYDSLLLLVGTCNWSLGPKIRHDDGGELAHSPEIKAMMAELYPVLSETQVKHLIADDIEKQYAEALQNYNDSFKYPFLSFLNNADNAAARAITRELEGPALKKRGAEFIRCVYGLNRGLAKDTLYVFVNAIPDFARPIYYAGQTWLTAKTEPAAPRC